MANLGLQGPFSHNNETIDETVKHTAPGNYALGATNAGGTFIVKYVGRSDVDLNQELKVRLDKGHPQFKAAYASSAKEAFEKECSNFHDFGGTKSLENEIHPAKPKNSNWRCPYCGQ